MNKLLLDKVSELSIELNEKQVEQFIKFYEMLVEWNKVMNLTGITEYEEVVEKHFVDSLSIVKAVDIKKVNTVIDIGTGAGFPGIPLKIAFPHLKITLLDSLNKRIKFLNAVIDELGLEDIYTIHGRAEDFAKQEEYREKYDLCVSRAVARLASLCEFCIPFVKKGGAFVAYKAMKSEEELAEANWKTPKMIIAMPSMYILRLINVLPNMIVQTPMMIFMRENLVICLTPNARPDTINPRPTTVISRLRTLPRRRASISPAIMENKPELI